MFYVTLDFVFGHMLFKVRSVRSSLTQVPGDEDSTRFCGIVELVALSPWISHNNYHAMDIMKGKWNQVKVSCRVCNIVSSLVLSGQVLLQRTYVHF